MSNINEEFVNSMSDEEEFTNRWVRYMMEEANFIDNMIKEEEQFTNYMVEEEEQFVTNMLEEERQFINSMIEEEQFIDNMIEEEEKLTNYVVEEEEQFVTNMLEKEEQFVNHMMEEYHKQVIDNTMSTTQDSVTVHITLVTGTREKILQMLQSMIVVDCMSENGDTVLHAILRNEKLIERHVIEILAIFLNQGVNPNIQNNHEQTALHLAVEKRMKDALYLLLTVGGDIKVISKCGNSIAHFFIKDEYEKCQVAMRYPIMDALKIFEITEVLSVSFLEFLMSKGLDFDCKNKEGQSAVHFAMKYQLLHILPTLLKHTKDILFIDKDNKTLLHIFLEAKSQLYNERPCSRYHSRYAVRIIKIMLDKGVPFLTSDKNGCTLLSNAIKMSKEMDIIETLINFYLDKCDNKDLATNLFHELLSTFAFWIDSKNDYFLTVLRNLASKGISINIGLLRKRLVLTEKDIKNTRLLKFLKENGIIYRIRSEYLLRFFVQQNGYQGSNVHSDVVFCGNGEVTDEQGKSVLQEAVGNGDVSMVRKLIQLSANVNNRDDSMKTPLHDAVMLKKAAEMIDLLLSNGAHVNVKDHSSETPLHLAVYHSDLATVKLLLERGASVDVKDGFQHTPLHHVRWDTDEAANIVDLLLVNGANPNARDHAGNVALHFAASRDNLAAVDFLVTSGADVNAKDGQSRTPLHLAVSSNNLAVALILLHNGASVNCKDQIQQTPLHRALLPKYVQLGMVELLVASGADVNAKDYEGNRPLHYVLKVRDLELDYPSTSSTERILKLLTMLLEKGAYVNARNKQGNSALLYALWLRRSALVDELLKKGASLDDRNVRQFIVLNINHLVFFLWHHWVKLKNANLPLHGVYKTYTKVIVNQEYQNECSREVEKLKNTLIGINKSLYDFLHTKSTFRGAYTSNEKLQQLINAPQRLMEEFPIYHVIILGSYHEAMTTKSLLGPAREALCRLMQNRLPDAIDQILDYLDDGDWINIIEANE